MAEFPTSGFKISIFFSLSNRYKKKGKTGMAIVDVGVLTGYEVDEQSVVTVNILSYYPI